MFLPIEALLLMSDFHWVALLGIIHVVLMLCVGILGMTEVNYNYHHGGLRLLADELWAHANYLNS